MKKLSLFLLAALFLAPTLIMADPMNDNSGATNTPAANGGTSNQQINAAQTGKTDKKTKKHNANKKKKSKKTSAKPVAPQ